MRYMMLIHHDDEAFAKASKDEMQQLNADYAAFNEALSKADGASTGERLQPSTAATSVSVRDGKKQILDGPYADTREQFAGYFMIEAPDLDGAIDWATRCPSNRFGTIEIRPMHEQEG